MNKPSEERDLTRKPNRTPGQAEGSEEDIDALTESGTSKQTVSRDPKVARSKAPEPGKTPGQAEG